MLAGEPMFDGRIAWHACALLAAATLAAACERPAAPACPRDALALGSADTPSSHPKRDIVLRYFPFTFVPGSEGPGERVAMLSDFEASWYAGKLIDYGEASLSERALDRTVEAYRVLQIPSLQLVGDFSIRVERGTLESKRPALCEKGREYGKVIASQKYVLGDAVWLEIAACMDRAFWNAPIADSVEGFDGWTTVFEGVRGGSYHVVSRWELHGREEASDRRALARCRSLLEAAAGWTHDAP
jgi:hypothetical protein